MPTRQQRIEGGLIGLLVGDALGVPYEFHSPLEIPSRHEIEFEPPRGFHRAHAGVPPGTWSDDGALALCLLASLLRKDRFDPIDFGARLVDWYQKGYMAVDSHVYDAGGTTIAGINRIAVGVPPLDAGPIGELDCGNGALMRALPLALWHRGSDAQLAHDAALQSRLTHGHLRSQVCCVLYVLWARRTLDEAPDPWNAAVAVCREIYRDDESSLIELDSKIYPDLPAGGNGSGYVVDCLNSARWADAHGGFEDVVRAAISLGNDTDTTACVAGGIAGLRLGIGAIPERWRRDLRGMPLVRPLLDELIAKSSKSLESNSENA